MTAFRTYLLLLLVSGVGIHTVSAQESNAVIDQVQSAFSKGDTSGIVAFVQQTVEIALLGQSGKYSRSQATHVLRKFFEENQPRQFEVREITRVQRGWFVEGTLDLDSDRGALLVYLRFNRLDEAWHLREILIERPRR